MNKIIHKELSYKINGLFFEVHKELGFFRNEKQYGDFLEKLLIRDNVSYNREYRFEDKQYGQEIVRCICDFIVDDKIILELKTKDYLTKDDYYQTKRYLHTLNLELGLIVNFRQKRITAKRVLNSSYFNKKLNL